MVVLTLPSVARAGEREWTTDADFTAGTSLDLTIGSDAITLGTEGVGTPDAAVAWWNSDWGQRRCLDVTNNEATTLTDFQVSFAVDTATAIADARMNATGDDIRFVSADGATVLDYWIEGPIDDAATTIWVQTDTLPSGLSSICMYYDNPVAPPASDIYAPFTYATPQPLYVAVSDTQNNEPIAVTSYVAGNVISDGITSVTLPAGGTHTFPAAGHTAATVVSATGPIAVQGTGNNTDTFVPIAFAGTDFVIPTNRGTNRVSVYAPFAAAAVVVEHSGTTTNIAVPAGTSVSVETDVAGGAESAIVTSDEPVLLTHRTGTNQDALVVIPASNEPLYGIRSTAHFTGFSTDATAVRLRESNGNALTIAGDAGGVVSRGAGGSFGAGPAVIATTITGGPIGSAQQADSDGNESTAFWPRSEHNVVYRTPVDIDYIAFACPFQTMGGLESDGTTLDCDGAGGAGFPGKALDSSGATAGALYESLDGTPFYVYAEDDATSDENNILGPKQARLATTNPPTLTIGPEESPYLPAATWTSDIHDTGCASSFAEIRWSPAAQPASTDVAFQVATAATVTGPFDFLGPDGTAGTSYTVAAGTAIAPTHDGDQFVQVEAVLTSADPARAPTVTDVEVSWQTANSISGTLFSDLDADGSIDLGDDGISGVDVTLWLDNGDGLFDPGTDTAVATATSIGDGTYRFENRPRGDYFVVADDTTLPPEFELPATTANPSGPVSLGDCDDLVTNLGWEPSRTVTATVFSDLDGDGTRDTSDIELAGVAVELWLDDGDGLFDADTDERVEVAQTDASGVAVFAGLPLGSYFVEVFRSPAGHSDEATTPNPEGPLTLTDGGVTQVEIGFEPLDELAGGTLILSGTAFIDENGDDAQQSGEEPIAGLFVGIYLDDGDGEFDAATDAIVTVVQTDPDGQYLATELDPGSYLVVPFDPPVASIIIDPVATTVTATGTTVADLPFDRTASISGAVVFDPDGDGVRDAASTPVPDLPVFLHRDDGDGTFNPTADQIVDVAASGADGSFIFEGVADDATHFVRVSTTPFLAESGVSVIGANPLGPLDAGATDVLFAFDTSDVRLPATGTGTPAILAIALTVLSLGLVLLGSTRRRSITPLS